MKTLQVSKTANITPVGESVVILLPQDFNPLTHYETLVKDFFEIGYFENNLNLAIKEEPKKFEAGKLYECQLFKNRSSELSMENISEYAQKNKWFVGGAIGMMFYWERARSLGTEYELGFCLSPTSNNSHIPYIYRSVNEQIMFGSIKNVKKEDEERSFRTAKYLILFRQV